MWLCFVLIVAVWTRTWGFTFFHKRRKRFYNIPTTLSRPFYSMYTLLFFLNKSNDGIHCGKILSLSQSLFSILFRQIIHIVFCVCLCSIRFSLTHFLSEKEYEAKKKYTNEMCNQIQPVVYSNFALFCFWPESKWGKLHTICIGKVFTLPTNMLLLSTTKFVRYSSWCMAALRLCHYNPTRKRIFFETFSNTKILFTLFH